MLLQTNCGNVARRISRRAPGQPAEIFDSCRESLTSAPESRCWRSAGFLVPRLKSDQVKRLKELETENARLRKAVSDLTLEKLILKEAASGNW